MSLVEVGQLYHPERTSWPERGVYEFRCGAHELLLFYNAPTAAEIAAVRRAPAEFKLYCTDDLIVFLYRIGDALPWSDAPYSWHLTNAADRVLPPQAGGHALLHIILVDATTGIVRAQRALTFSPTFTAALRNAIQEQAGRAWDAAAYDRRLRSLYAKYTTTQALLRVAQHSTHGGD